MRRVFEIHFFDTGTGFELVETRFTSFDGQARRCIRGKTAGAFRGSGSFQWTSGVKALAALSLRHVLSQITPIINKHITGQQTSLAASLDYAITKAPCWLSDMFGVLQNGQVAARRILLITNPNQKRPGPVTVAINDAVLSPDEIQVFINGCPTTEFSALMNILRDIETDPSQDLYDSACGLVKLAS